MSIGLPGDGTFFNPACEIPENPLHRTSWMFLLASGINEYPHVSILYSNTCKLNENATFTFAGKAAIASSAFPSRGASFHV